MDRHSLNKKLHIAGYRFTSFILFLFVMLAPLHSTLAALPESRNELLQFTAGGHVLGFKNDSVYIAGGDHMLKVEFTGTTGAYPVANKATQSASDAQAFNYVTYNDLWPGVDLVYKGTANGIFESTWQIAPGSTPEQIRLRYNAPIEIDPSGDLKISYETGWMRESAPIAWQQIDGRRIPVQIAFNIIEASDGKADVGFNLGQYNPSHPLLIDPILDWNTFLGSSELDEGYAMTLDDSDNIYLAGISAATWGSPVVSYPGGSGNAFVAKLDSTGALQWHTFLGSEESYDKGTGVAVDSSGNVYVTGTSSSTWGSPVIAHGGGGGDAFVAKLNSSGNRLWNTFIGSTGYDEGSGIVVDSTANIYFIGTKNGQAFATKMNTNGFVLWNKFMGEPTSSDKGLGIALDGANNVYVVGESMLSWGTPITAHTGDGTWPSVFTAKINNSGALQWNTFMGSANTDMGGAITVDTTGNAYVTGTSDSDWGSPLNAFAAGGTNAFVLKLDTDGARVWQTFIGSTDVNVWGKAITLDSTGNPHLAGYSNASWGTPINAHAGGSTDAYAAKLDTFGSLQWNTFMGSTEADEGRAIAVDLAGNVYVAGDSVASWGAPINAYAGNRDVFVAEICASCYTVSTSAPVDEGFFTPTVQGVTSGDTTTFDVTANTGYTIDTVTGCGGTWTESNPYTTGEISDDCTVTATFTLNSYTVDTSAPADQGSFSPTERTVNHGSTTTFDVNPENGYSIDNVTGCGGTWTGDNPYTTGEITSTCTV
ncbi:MAG: SBBP repeat-containing protein, partial [Proteobacteria bacterium]|nr:SBBP repeat-containing protein [Pseudomonadota bacterium]